MLEIIFALVMSFNLTLDTVMRDVFGLDCVNDLKIVVNYHVIAYKEESWR